MHVAAAAVHVLVVQIVLASGCVTSAPPSPALGHNSEPAPEASPDDEAVVREMEVPEVLDRPRRPAHPVVEHLKVVLARHREGLAGCMQSHRSEATLGFRIEPDGRVLAQLEPDHPEIVRCMNEVLVEERLEPAPGYLITVRYPWR